MSKEDLLFEAALEEMRELDEEVGAAPVVLPYTQIESDEVELIEDLMSRPGWPLFLHRLWEVQVQWINIALDPRLGDRATATSKGIFQGLRMAEHMADNLLVEGKGGKKEAPDLSATKEHIPPRPGQRMTRRKKPQVARRKRT